MFEALAAGPGTGQIDRALDLYRGDLLSGLEIKEGEFESWLLPRRQRLRFLAIDLFGRYLAEASDIPRVAVVAERLQKLDPLSEIAHRALMRMYSAQGQHTAAMRQFDECRALLERELGTAPGAETVALYDRIRKSRRAPSGLPSAEAPPPPANIPDAAGAGPAPASDTRPSIAVLPFENLSPGEEDPYFADGITEEVTTALSYVQWLFVIARNSAFTFRGPDIEAGAKLDVRYLLLGSVRRADGVVRVNVRLVDVAQNAQIWAGRFESDVENVFALQDDLATEVVGAIQPGLRDAEIAIARRKPPDVLNAYDLYLRSLPHVYRMSEADTTQALTMLERAIAIDANFNRARSLCGWIYTLRQSQGWSKRGTGEARLAIEHARICLAHEMESDAEILWQAGYTLGYFDGNYEDSLAFIDRSLALNRNSAQAWIIRGMINGFIGRPEQAIEDCRTAIRLSPLDPLIYRAHYGLALAHVVLGDYRAAVRWARQGVASGPNYIPGYYMLIAGLANTGEDAECARVGERVLQLLPDMTVNRWRENTPIRCEPARQTIAESLRKAGLPA
ncbi:BTAD domain-containing putative transcriptional regulator [Paralimibaculum aggregatum]|nr:BTAD domain-containing putative transcriptional regulator [Limibaculum sp. NKW23]